MDISIKTFVPDKMHGTTKRHIRNKGPHGKNGFLVYMGESRDSEETVHLTKPGSRSNIDEVVFPRKNVRHHMRSFDFKEIREQIDDIPYQGVHIDSRNDTLQYNSHRQNNDYNRDEIDETYVRVIEGHVKDPRKKVKRRIRLNLSERMQSKARVMMMERRKERAINKEIMLSYLEQGTNHQLWKVPGGPGAADGRSPHQAKLRLISYGPDRPRPLPPDAADARAVRTDRAVATGGPSATLLPGGGTRRRGAEAAGGGGSIFSFDGEGCRRDGGYLNSIRFREESRTIMSGFRIDYDPPFHYSSSKDGPNYKSWISESAEKKEKDGKKAALVNRSCILRGVQR